MKWLKSLEDRVSQQSPPSRAAWIEIRLRMELANTDGSPPSRAAWIEIVVTPVMPEAVTVAAFTGGVD